MPKSAKKDLKQFINENGFFLQSDAVTAVDKQEAEALTDAFRTRVKLPSGNNVQVYRGKLSQNFPKGEKSRNGYKYDHTGVMLDSYKDKPIVLLQHDSEMPIGYVLNIAVTPDDGIDITYFVDFSTQAAKKYEHEIKSGYIGMLSTGAISHDWLIEDNKTGERLSPQEARARGWDIWDEDNYTRVVTKWELVESSVVTIGSNPKALTAQNSLKHSFNQQFMSLKDDVSTAIARAAAHAERMDGGVGEPETTETPQTPEAEAEETQDDTPPAPEATGETETPDDATGANPDSDEAEAETTPEAPAPAAEAQGDAFPQWARDVFVSFANALATQEQEIKALKRKLDSTPVDKSLKVTSQLSEAAKPTKGGALIDMLKSVGAVR